MIRKQFERRRNLHQLWVGAVAVLMAVTLGIGYSTSSAARAFQERITPVLVAASHQRSSPFAEQSKESLVVRMAELDALIASTKEQLISHAKNQELLAQMNAAQTEYDQISEYLGGDRAAPTGRLRGSPTSGAMALLDEIIRLRQQLDDDPDNQALRDRLRMLSASLGGSFPVQGDNIAAMGGATAPPPGCTATTTEFSSFGSGAVAISPGPPSVVSSTINVTGGTYLHDLNLQTYINHTFNADLDITIQSPAGTVVTLTTDNGGENDNVFTGTVWDDDANPSGLVPYTHNDGLVTDRLYANNMIATALVPEEALAAFNGEDPNGPWTLTISDDTNGDGGVLSIWFISVTTLSTAPIETTFAFTNATPVAIPDFVDAVSSTLNVTGAATSLNKVTLLTNLTHTFPADLDITIQSPALTIVTLTTDNGGDRDDVFNGTLWDDDANPAGQVPYTNNNGLVTDHLYVSTVLASPLAPEEALGAFIGEDPNGIWTITISDDASLDGGSLNSWTLNITTATCPPPCTITCPANITVANQCGSVVNYPPPVTLGNCGSVICSPSSGSFFPAGATTVTCTASAGQSCSFTITVNDTQPPSITCPATFTAVGSATGTVVTFPSPTATDNCPGVTTTCTPASGSTFPPGTTTVDCTASDGSGNTATCSFTVAVFDVCLQDSSNPSKVLLINSSSGEYRFCCGGTIFTGTGTVNKKGNTVTLEHITSDRRVMGKSTGGGKGSGSLQSPPGTTICTISDSTSGNGTCACP